jgi:hypothetical protein
LRVRWYSRRQHALPDRAAWRAGWGSLGCLSCLSVICLPQSSFCQRSLVEGRPKLPLCIVARSVGLCDRVACGASNLWRRLATRRTLRGLMVAQTNPAPSSEYAPAGRAGSTQFRCHNQTNQLPVEHRPLTRPGRHLRNPPAEARDSFFARSAVRQPSGRLPAAPTYYINLKPLIMNSANAAVTPSDIAEKESAFSNLDCIIDDLPTILATNRVQN